MKLSYFINKLLRPLYAAIVCTTLATGVLAPSASATTWEIVDYISDSGSSRIRLFDSATTTWNLQEGDTIYVVGRGLRSGYYTVGFYVYNLDLGLNLDGATLLQTSGSTANVASYGVELGATSSNVSIGTISAMIQAQCTSESVSSNPAYAIFTSSSNNYTITIAEIDSTSLYASSYSGTATTVYLDSGSTITGDIYIENAYAFSSANASMIFYLYGGSIEGEMTGTYRSLSTNTTAYGYRLAAGAEISGIFNAELTVTAGGTGYGIDIYGGSSITNDIGVNGDTSYVTVSGTAAYGLKVNGTTDATYGVSKVTGSIYSDITATSSSGLAMGIDIHDGATLGTSNAGTVIAGDITVTSSGGAAYGIYSNSTSYIYSSVTGDITVEATGGNAYGIDLDYYAYIEGDIIGNIDVEAHGSYDAYAIASNWWGRIDGTISGDITATVEDGSAYGLYVYRNGWYKIITSDIEAIATGSGDAYGLYIQGASSSQANTQGNISGSITASANTGDAYAIALLEDSYIYYGTLSSTLSASSVSGDAYGISLSDNTSYSTVTYTSNAITGNISASSGSGSAYGISLTDATYISGAISSAITASSTSGTAYALSITEGSYLTKSFTGSMDVSGYKAYGVYTDADSVAATSSSVIYSGDLTMNTTNGYVYGYLSGINASSTASIGYYNSATSNSSGITIDWANLDFDLTGVSYVYGIRLYSASELSPGTIGGGISVTSSNTYAYGIYNYASTLNANINSIITAEGTQAYGIYNSNSSASITGNITGDITATAKTAYAYGIYNSSGSITGDITSNITATSTSSYAYGIYNSSGSITGDITGNITATSTGSYAYGIYYTGAKSSIDSDITADITVNAVYAARGISFYSGTTFEGNIGIASPTETNEQSLIQVKSSGTSDSYYAAGLNIWGASSSNYAILAGNIYADIDAVNTGSSSAYGVYLYNYATIGSADTSYDFSSDITVEGNSTVAGIYVNSEYGTIYSDYTGAMTLTATGSSARAYGVYTNSTSLANSSDTVYSGDLSITADAGQVYGYVLGTEVSTDSVGYYNSSTSNSQDINVDWENLNFNLTADGGNSHGFVIFDGDLDVGTIGGSITVNAENNIAYGFYIYEKDGTSTELSSDIASSLTITGKKAVGFAILGDKSGVQVEVSGDITGDMTITSTGNEAAYGFDIYYGALISGDIGIADTTDDDQTLITVIGGTSSTNIEGIRLYGSYGDNSITGNIYADFELTNEGSGYAFAIQASNSTIGLEDGSTVISGDISVSSVGEANGIRSISGSTIYSDFTGNISITAQSSGTGIYLSDASLFSGDIGIAEQSLIEVSATSSSSGYISGIRLEDTSSGTTSLTGDIYADIEVSHAGTGYAYGIYQGTSTALSGDLISGDISVTSNAHAYGIYSAGTLSAAVSSDITVDGTNAYGYYISNGTIAASISGSVTATGSYDAAGFYMIGATADADISLSSTLNINSDTNRAWGYYITGSSDIAADIDGSITVSADAYYSRGIVLEGSSIMTGDINANLDISSSENALTAYAIYLNAASLSGDITGTVEATTVDTVADAIRLATAGSFSGTMSGALIANATSDTATGINILGASEFSGKIAGTITANSTENVARGIYLREASTFSGTLSSDSSITVEGATAYGIYADDDSLTNSSDSSFAGTINLTTASSTSAYGYVLGTTTDGSVAYYNSSTNDSSNFGMIDWDNTILNITNSGGNAYGLSLTNQTTDETFAGKFFVTSSTKAYGLDSYYTTFNNTLEGDYTVETTGASSSSYGVYARYSTFSDGIAANLTVEIESDDTTGNAHGIYSNNSTLGIITGDITVSNNNGDSTGIHLYFSTVEDISGSIKASAKSTAYGVNLYNNATVDNISGHVEVSSTTGYAYGVYLFQSGTLENITGTVDASTVDGTAWGIITIGSSSIGVDSALTGIITATATGSGDAYGARLNNSQLAGGTFTATSNTGTAYGVSIVGTTSTIDGSSFTATTTSGTAYGIYLSSDASIASMSDVDVTIEVNSDNTAYGYYAGSDAEGSSMALFDEANGNSTSFDLDGTWNSTDNTISITNDGGDVVGAYFTGDASGVLNTSLVLDGDNVILAQYDDLTADSAELGILGGDVSITYDSSAALMLLSDSTIGDLSLSIGEGELSLSSTSSSASLALLTVSNSTVTNLTGDAISYAGGSTSTTGIVLSDSSSITNFDQDIDLSSSSGTVIALDVQSDSSVGSISSSLTATTTTTDTAYALNLADGSSLTGGLTVDAVLSATSTSTTAVGTAYGLFAAEGSSISGDLLGSITATGPIAYGLVIDGATVAEDVVIGGTISVTSNYKAQAIVLTDTTIKKISSTVTAEVDSNYYVATTIGYNLDNTTVDLISGSATVSNNYDDVTGLNITNGSYVGEYAGDLTVTATQADDKAYGIFVSDDSSLDIFTGSLDLTANSTSIIYGYNNYSYCNGYSMGLYNYAEKSSAGIDVDWTHADLSVTNTSTNSSGKATALYLSGVWDADESTYIGGDISATSNSYSVGIYLTGTEKSITGITDSVSAIGSSNSYAIYLAGDTTLSDGISADVYLKSTSYSSHAIYSDGTADAGLFSGSLTMVSTSTSFGYTIFGYSNVTASSQHSYGLYDATTYNSSTFELDWANLDFDITNVSTATGTYDSVVLVQLGNVDWSDTVIGGSLVASSQDSNSSSIGLELSSNTSLKSIGTAEDAIDISLTSPGRSFGIALDYGSSDITISDGIYAKVTLTGNHTVPSYVYDYSYGIQLTNTTISNNGITANVSVSDFYSAYGMSLSGSTIDGGIDGSISVMSDYIATALAISSTSGITDITADITAFSDRTATGIESSSSSISSISGDIYVAAGLADMSDGYDSDLASSSSSWTWGTGISLYASTIESLSGDVSVRSLGSATGLSLSNSDGKTTAISSISSDITVTAGYDAIGVSLDDMSSVTFDEGSSLTITLQSSEASLSSTGSLVAFEYGSMTSKTTASVSMNGTLDMVADVSYLDSASLILHKIDNAEYSSSALDVSATFDSLTLTNTGGNTVDVEVAAVQVTSSSSLSGITGNVVLDSNNLSLTGDGKMNISLIGIQTGNYTSNYTLTVDAISSNITVNNSYGSAIGLDAQGYYMESYGGAYIGNSILGKVNGDISVTALSEATGVALTVWSNATSINGAIKVTGETATGVLVNEWSSVESITGAVTVTGTDSAVGISLSNQGAEEGTGEYDEDWNEIMVTLDTTPTLISGDVTAKSDGNATAIELSNLASVSAISGIVAAEGTDTIGLLLDDCSQVESISGTIKATGTSTTYALYSDSADATIGDFSGTLEALISKGTGAAISLTDGASITGEQTGLLKVSLYDNGTLAYGVYTDNASAALSTFSGHLDMSAEITNVLYAYVLGDDITTSMGYYNSDTQDSSSITINWADLDWAIENTLRQATAIMLTAGESLGSAEAYVTLDGDIDVTGVYETIGLDLSDGASAYINSTLDWTVISSASNASGIVVDAATIAASLGGDLTVTSTGSSYTAEGIVLSNESSLSGSLTAMISATSALDATGISISGSSLMSSELLSTIRAESTKGVATGLALAAGSSATGQLGVISDESPSTIFATGLTAYGISVTGSDTKLIGNSYYNVDALSSTGNSYAYYASDSATISGVIGGSISSTSTANKAYGIYADGGAQITGAITAGITTTSNNVQAYGIYAGGSAAITGDIIGAITVNSTSSNAYGVYLENGATLGNAETGSLVSSTISVSTGSNNAYGVYASDSTIDADMTGTITATISAANSAYGVYLSDSTMTGDLSADINASGTVNFSYYSKDAIYGLYLTDGASITGEVSSTISSTSSYGYATSVYVGSSSLTVSGSLSATGSYAIGAELAGTGSLSLGENASITVTSSYEATGLLFSDASGDFDIDWGSQVTLASNGNITALVRVSDGSNIGSLSVDTSEWTLKLASDSAIYALDVINSTITSVDSDIYLDEGVAYQMGIQLSNSTIGTINNDISVLGYTGMNVGISFLDSTSYITDAYTDTITVEGASAYGVMLNGTASSSTMEFAGTLDLSSESTAYGYMLGVTANVGTTDGSTWDSVAFISSGTLDSTGFDIDWANASINITSTDSDAIGFALGSSKSLSLEGTHSITSETATATAFLLSGGSITLGQASSAEDTEIMTLDLDTVIDTDITVTGVTAVGIDMSGYSSFTLNEGAIITVNGSEESIGLSIHDLDSEGYNELTLTTDGVIQLVADTGTATFVDVNNATVSKLTLDTSTWTASLADDITLNGMVVTNSSISNLSGHIALQEAQEQSIGLSITDAQINYVYADITVTNADVNIGISLDNLTYTMFYYGTLSVSGEQAFGIQAEYSTELNYMCGFYGTLDLTSTNTDSSSTAYGYLLGGTISEGDSLGFITEDDNSYGFASPQLGSSINITSEYGNATLWSATNTTHEVELGLYYSMSGTHSVTAEQGTAIALELNTSEIFLNSDVNITATGQEAIGLQVTGKSSINSGNDTGAIISVVGTEKSVGIKVEDTTLSSSDGSIYFSYTATFDITALTGEAILMEISDSSISTFTYNCNTTWQVTTGEDVATTGLLIDGSDVYTVTTTFAYDHESDLSYGIVFDNDSYSSNLYIDINISNAETAVGILVKDSDSYAGIHRGLITVSGDEAFGILLESYNGDNQAYVLGSIDLTSTSDDSSSTAYGYVAGTSIADGDSLALATQAGNSTGIDVSWTQADLYITSENGDATIFNLVDQEDTFEASSTHSATALKGTATGVALDSSSMSFGSSAGSSITVVGDYGVGVAMTGDSDFTLASNGTLSVAGSSGSTVFDLDAATGDAAIVTDGTVTVNLGSGYNYPNYLVNVSNSTLDSLSFDSSTWTTTNTDWVAAAGLDISNSTIDELSAHVAITTDFAYGIVLSSEDSFINDYTDTTVTVTAGLTGYGIWYYTSVDVDAQASFTGTLNMITTSDPSVYMTQLGLSTTYGYVLGSYLTTTDSLGFYYGDQGEGSICSEGVKVDWTTASINLTSMVGNATGLSLTDQTETLSLQSTHSITAKSGVAIGVVLDNSSFELGAEDDTATVLSITGASATGIQLNGTASASVASGATLNVTGDIAYGVTSDSTESLGDAFSFDGTLNLTSTSSSTSSTTYGYIVGGNIATGDSLGFMNADGNSSSFDIDWSAASLNITSTNGNATGWSLTDTASASSITGSHSVSASSGTAVGVSLNGSSLMLGSVSISTFATRTVTETVQDTDLTVTGENAIGVEMVGDSSFTLTDSGSMTVSGTTSTVGISMSAATDETSVAIAGEVNINADSGSVTLVEVKDGSDIASMDIDTSTWNVTTAEDVNVLGVAATDSTIDSVDAKIAVSATGEGNAYGLTLDNSTVGAVTADIAVVSEKEAVAVYLENDSSIGTISADITATSTGGDETGAIGIYSEYKQTTTFTFAHDQDVSIQATADAGDAATYAILIMSEETILKLDDVIDANQTTSISGDIAVFGALSFESGNYDVTANVIYASSISMADSSVSTVNITTTTQLVDYVDQDGTTLNFTVSSYDSGNIALTIAEGASLIGIDAINIYLSEEVLAYLTANQYYEIELVSGDLTGGEAISIEDLETLINVYSIDSSGTTASVSSTYAIASASGITLNVPEPSTSTLSLLALTALLARRRRKSA